MKYDRKGKVVEKSSRGMTTATRTRRSGGGASVVRTSAIHTTPMSSIQVITTSINQMRGKGISRPS